MADWNGAFLNKAKKKQIELLFMLKIKMYFENLIVMKMIDWNCVFWNKAK